MDKKINLNKYIAEVKKNLKTIVSDEIIEKDLLLTLILGELEKHGIGKDLIFKGGTLLSRNYLNYHRFSEDLDFVHKDSSKLRSLQRRPRERAIKEFIDSFAPKLMKTANSLGMNFSEDRSNTKYCTVLHGRAVYIFRLYYAEDRFIRIEINFIEKIIHKPETTQVKTITDFFDSKPLLFTLGLNIKNLHVLGYNLKEIIIEKYRAVLTRDQLMERDLFDLFLIKNSLKVSIDEVLEKIESSSLIKKDLKKLISNKLLLLEKNEFFKSIEKVEDLAIIEYNTKKFEEFKTKIKPILINICRIYLNKV